MDINILLFLFYVNLILVNKMENLKEEQISNNNDQLKNYDSIFF